MIIALMIVLLRGWRGKNRNKITKIVSVALHISGTIYHIIVINDDISWRFFHFFKNFEFLACQVKGQKITKMKNNYIHHTPYIRNSIAYDHDFWYIYISIYSRYIYIYAGIFIYAGIYRYTSTVTHMSYKIDCNNKCLIYLLTCKTCLKQYVGSTTDCFRYRWNNYKCNDRKFARGEACLQEYLFEHFNSEGHNGFLHDVLVTLNDKTDAKNSIKREHYWWHTLKTLAPDGLNVEDDF